MRLLREFSGVVLGLLILSCTTDKPPSEKAPAPAPGTSSDGSVVFKSPPGRAPVHIDAYGHPEHGIATMKAVRVAAPVGGGWDRIVFEFRDGLPQTNVEVADSLVGCGSGYAISVAGSSLLAVQFRGAQAHDFSGNASFDSTQVTGPGISILEAKSTCDFEGIVEWGIGLRGTPAFQVTAQIHPPCLVVDVKHE
jgi:hypothetical protein